MVLVVTLEGLVRLGELVMAVTRCGSRRLDQTTLLKVVEACGHLLRRSGDLTLMLGAFMLRCLD